MPKCKYSFIFFLICGIILLLPFVFIQDGPEWCNFSNKGEIGDVIGGTTAPFIAILATYVTFLAFWVQYEFNKQQRKDTAVERFEHNLFEMIALQENITNNLVWEFIKDNDPNQINTYESNIIMRQKGRDVFQVLYEFYPFTVEMRGKHRDLKEYEDYEGFKDLFARNDDAYTYYERDGTTGMLDHYFRHLYWIFKYIKECDIIDEEHKYRYACIVRSSLSQYELVFLFYNGLSKKGKNKFKTLIEEFSLLNNLRLNLLASDDERLLYESKFTDTYSYEKDAMRPDSEYKKSAFVHRNKTN